MAILILLWHNRISQWFCDVKNLKKGFYAAPVTYHSPAAAKDIVVADFNNDGLKDVARYQTQGRRLPVTVFLFYESWKRPFYNAR